MRYYKNRTTDQIIGISNMREVITPPTELSNKLGFKGYHFMIVYDAIYPNFILGNGIASFCIQASFLTKAYKRINKKIALAKYPEFRQYKHKDMVIEAERRGISGLEVLQGQTI